VWDPDSEQTYAVEYKLQIETVNEQVQKVNSKGLDATFDMTPKFVRGIKVFLNNIRIRDTFRETS
jgi:hypothetical protein